MAHTVAGTEPRLGRGKKAQEHTWPNAEDKAPPNVHSLLETVTREAWEYTQAKWSVSWVQASQLVEVTWFLGWPYRQ